MDEIYTINTLLEADKNSEMKKELSPEDEEACITALKNHTNHNQNGKKKRENVSRS
jgi:hypothetical protein